VGQFSQAIAEVEENLSQLLDEIRRLKYYIDTLEDENIRLKRQLCVIPNLDAGRIQKNAALIQKEAWENLDRLYQEGFHVCHIYFGEPLENVCLFCSAFLSKEG